MNNIELSKLALEDDILCADELWHTILKTVGSDSQVVSVDGNKCEKYDCGVSLYPINKFEMLCYLFGTLTSDEVFDMEIPYENDVFFSSRQEYEESQKKKRAILYNQLHRCVAKGTLERKSIYTVDSKNTENGSRNLYGITKVGANKMKEISLKMGINNKFGERKTSKHEYAVSLSLLSLIRHSMSIKYETEVVKHIRDELSKLTDNESIRADAEIVYNDEVFYLEQDMLTETTKTVLNKLRFYRKKDNKLIFTFHKTNKTPSIPKKDLALIESFADFGYSTSDIISMAKKKELLISKEGIKMLECAYLLNPSEDCKDIVVPFITYIGKDKISKALKYESMLNTVEIKTLHLFKDILNEDELRHLLENGMNVFTSTSELLYKSVAFCYAPSAIELLKRVAGNREYVKVATNPVHAHGVFFSNRIEFRNKNMYLEFAQEDIGGLVRVYKSYNSIENSNDELVIVYNTDSFLGKIIELLSRKKKTFNNLIFINRFTYDIFKLESGNLVEMRE